MKRTRLVLLFLLLAAVALTVGYWRLTVRPPSPVETVSDAAPVDFGNIDLGNPETEEGKALRQVLGVWQDDYQGKRTMTLKADGTGTMLVELSGAQAFLFASKLRFDMKWSLDGKALKKKTIGGDPADKVNMILNTMGDTAVDTILEVTEDRLLLLDQDGKTEYDWRRAKPGEARTP